MNGAPQKILVLGAGNFGTCLAHHLAKLGHTVKMWARDPLVVQSINTHHLNPRYLKTITLDSNLQAIFELHATEIENAHVIVFAIPTQFLRKVLQEKIIHHLKPHHLLVSAVKGIETKTLLFPSGILKDVMSDSNPLVILSGPSFAIEVATGQPTGVSVACNNLELAKKAQKIFHAPRFRVYSSDDSIGLEVAGAVKNVIAIASGACAGLGFQSNSRATLITRGLAEITRLGVALGANPLTFNGLGGVGDLFLTCNSAQSRNYSVGYELGKGKTLEAVVENLGSIAEGVVTTEATHALSHKLNVSTPIIDAVYQVLYQNQPIVKV
ncbi:MAG: NAD(P)H-dependent glycerol-3-phosphate dehydrogenase, partial [Pseudomonadota bacterium]